VCDKARKTLTKFGEFDNLAGERFPLVSFETHRETFHRWQVY